MKKKRHFSLDEANAILPNVADHMRRVLQLHSHLRGCANQLSEAQLSVSPALLSEPNPENCPQDLRPILSQAQALYASIRNELKQIHELGAQVKDVESGLVDFYSYRDGLDEVLLCWRVGERQITHYHDEKQGFGGRRSVNGHSFVSARHAHIAEEV